MESNKEKKMYEYEIFTGMYMNKWMVDILHLMNASKGILPLVWNIKKTKVWLKLWTNLGTQYWFLTSQAFNYSKDQVM